jgi:tRNA threonylcarbamoyl adenosine modification protein YeaZ
MQLAIDTSTDMASVALVNDDRVFAEMTWHSGQNHTTQLLPHVNYLMDKFSIKDIDGIFVAKGPGSFNGLRVGVSTAKGLAFSLGIPIVGIGTLEAAAYQHAETGLPICPVFNAGRGEVATAVYRMLDRRWQQLKPEHITTVDALCAETTVRTLFCGDYVASVAPQLRDTLGRKAIISTTASSLRRASSLAELGRPRFKTGDSDNPATLQPVYLRRPPITERKHR